MCKRFHFLSFSHMRYWFVFANRYYVQKNIYDVSGKIYFWHSHHMMLGSKGILTPLIPNCYVLCTPAILKTFVIRSFFFKKWLLTHVFGGSQVQKSSCKQACIGFMTFWPWYHVMMHNSFFSRYTNWCQSKSVGSWEMKIYAGIFKSRSRGCSRSTCKKT